MDKIINRLINLRKNIEGGHITDVMKISVEMIKIESDLQQLTDVSQQRELLNQYNEFINTQYSYNDLSENDTIDFFEWFNCG